MRGAKLVRASARNARMSESAVVSTGAKELNAEPRLFVKFLLRPAGVGSIARSRSLRCAAGICSRLQLAVSNEKFSAKKEKNTTKHLL
jgi:hypothetical protein